MKLLHTADWHLGRRLEGRPRHDEQRDVLDALCRLCDDERIDAVVIAGDLFDSYNPPAESEALCYETLARLSDGGRRAVVVIAGNHDSPDRLLAPTPYARVLGISVVGLPHDVPVLWDGGSGRCACVAADRSFLRIRSASGEHLSIVALPYPSESRLREVLTDDIDDEAEMAHAYAGRVASFLEDRARLFEDDALKIITSHLFVAGGAESDSERQIQAGGAYAVPPDVLGEDAHYVALGHLHRPQQMEGRDDVPVVYSGSLLQYSFSEAGQRKSVVIVENDRAHVSHRRVDLPAGRPLERWKNVDGTAELERRLAECDPMTWLSITVRLDHALEPDYMARVRSQHPNILLCMPDYRSEQTAAEGPSFDELPLEQQFRRFVEARNGEPPADDVVELFLSMAARTSDEDTAEHD